MIEGLFVNLMNGVYYGAILFLIASGLTVIFGILGILNLAHGEMYALGAYTGITVIGFLFNTLITPSSGIIVVVGVFLIGVLVSGIISIPIGYLTEVVLMRRLYDREDYYQLLLTFGLLLALTGSIKFIWGSSPISSPKSYRIINSLKITNTFGFEYPTYNVLVIFMAILTFLLMLVFFNKTKHGRMIRATAINREMASAIGIDTKRTFTHVFTLGVFLAGFGGALAAPPIAATLGMGLKPLILAFVVIVVGGIGSIHGAFVASIFIGVVSKLSIWLYPPGELAAPFVLMAIILLLKPQGLFKSWGEYE